MPEDDSTDSRCLHRLAELRSLAYHRAVAQRIQSEPEILKHARARVDRWIEEGGRSVRYARLWKDGLARPVPQIVSLLVDDSEGSNAMRKSTPFAGVIDPRERWRIWRQIREQTGLAP